MSTKTSSLNTSANNSPASPGSMSSASAATSAATVVKIKKELPSDEIKEFAESTMNELLGWYGFDNVDRLDISAKTSKILQSAALLNTQQQQQHQQNMERRRSRSNRISALLQMQQHQQQQQQQQHQQQQQNEQHLRSQSNNNNDSNSNSNNANINNNNTIGCNLKTSSSSTRKNSISSNNYRGCGANDSTASDHDTRSSRDDDSKSPNSTLKFQLNTGATTTSGGPIDEKLDFKNCCWCRRPVPENAPDFLTTSDGPRYCSESCFTQSRRASFKKAKTCDWCKHVRHAVSYVDFQDGASQLQFCSDKCLNQYKMQIFCKETQAHLDMNPHLKEQGLKESNNLANLITPDLWLKNCRSRSASPASTMSVSPGPPLLNSTENMVESTTPTISISPPKISANNNSQTPVNVAYKPMISVAPVSKLMSKSPSIMTTRQSPKHNRKKKPIKACAPSDITNNRSEGKVSSGTSLPVGLKSKPLLAPLSENNRVNMSQASGAALTQFAASCVQDLHMSVPPLSPMMDSLPSQPTTPHSLPSNGGGGRVGANIPPPVFFASPANGSGMHQQTPPPVMPPTGFPPRPPFIPNPGGFLPRFMGNFPGIQQPPNMMMSPDMAAINALVGTPPPVTVMVPYPVIIPLPIPIPIPLPVTDFYKAYLSPEERKKFDEQQNIKKEQDKDLTTQKANERTAEAVQADEEREQREEPLDFTKTKEIQADKSPQADSRSIPLTEEVDADITSTSTSITPSEEMHINSPKPISTSTSLHCVITNDENLMETDEEAKKLKTNQTNECKNDEETNSEENNQKLPKLKITRLQTKRTLIQTKESECSRPLRKRKRIIDCDFQKIAAANSKETLEDEELQTTSAASNEITSTETND